MSLVAHRFGCVEFRIFVVVLCRHAHLKEIKSNIRKFEIRNVQINELPRTKDNILRFICPFHWIGQRLNTNY